MRDLNLESNYKYKMYVKEEGSKFGIDFKLIQLNYFSAVSNKIINNINSDE